MSWVLLGNDDGVDSPALLPFADALEERLEMPVAVAVPDGERSWSAKAVTRDRAVGSTTVVRGGRRIITVDGTPADAIQLGMHSLFDGEFDGARPALVVTGVNIGFNAGDAFLYSSGTVGAAAEAAYDGLSAVAVSTGRRDYEVWRRSAMTDDARSRAGWNAIAGLAASVVAEVTASDLQDHCDLVSVNLPWGAPPDCPWTVTGLSRLRYNSLFDPGDRGRHAIRRTLDLQIDEPSGEAPGDVAALLGGAVSITPVQLPRSTSVPQQTRDRLER